VGFVATPCVLFRQRETNRQNDDQEWRRLHFHTTAFGSISRRFLLKRPVAVLGAVPNFVRQRGAYAAYFALSARSHWARGEWRDAVRAIGRSLVASPAHAARVFMMTDSRAAAFALVILQDGPAFRL
jgi:hypothetical protein